MYNMDPMLNGRVSRLHLQQIIRQVQQERLAREAVAAQSRAKTVSPLRAVLATIMSLWVK